MLSCWQGWRKPNLSSLSWMVSRPSDVASRAVRRAGAKVSGVKPFKTIGEASLLGAVAEIICPSSMTPTMRWPGWLSPWLLSWRLWSRIWRRWPPCLSLGSSPLRPRLRRSSSLSYQRAPQPIIQAKLDTAKEWVTSAVDNLDSLACEGIDHLTARVPALKDATPELIGTAKVC